MTDRTGTVSAPYNHFLNSARNSSIVEIGRVHPNPAIQPNYCYFFAARGAHKVQKPQFDATEETEVVLVPLRRIKGLIASGRITHALVIAAFSFFHLYNPPPRRRARIEAKGGDLSAASRKITSGRK